MLWSICEAPGGCNPPNPMHALRPVGFALTMGFGKFSVCDARLYIWDRFLIS